MHKALMPGGRGINERRTERRGRGVPLWDRLGILVIHGVPSLVGSVEGTTGARLPDLLKWRFLGSLLPKGAATNFTTEPGGGCQGLQGKTLGAFVLQWGCQFEITRASKPRRCIQDAPRSF